MRVRGYAPGTPCWAAVASPDIAATRAFYNGLFGWEESGGRFAVDGRAVAGLWEQGDGPAAWLVSIATDDAAEVARAVERRGGEVRGWGDTTAVFADPSGATFATLRRGTFFGAQVSYEPGAICWYELAAHDLSVVDDFYSEVFGWRVMEAESVPGEPYFEFHHNGDAVAGLLPIDQRFGSRYVAPHWTVCFMVDDCAAACDRATELGGTVARKPVATSAGWSARVSDRYGAQFAVIELPPSLRVD